MQVAYTTKINTMKTKILITAANGNTGFTAAMELLKLGFPVRAFVRNAKSTKAKELNRLGAELFVGDIQDIRDVRKSLEGISRVYFVPTFPNILYQGTTFVAALAETNIEHVVLVTQWLSSNSNPSIYTRELWLVESMFKQLDLDLTVLNPGFFGNNYFLAPESFAQLGMFPDFGKNAPPSNEDIGLVGAHILKYPKSHIGNTYRITGKEVLSSQQMANIIGKLLGVKIKATKLPEKLLLKVLKAKGYSQMDISQVRSYFKEGHTGVWTVNGPTSVVKEIVGKEADDFETLAKRYIDSSPIFKQTLGNKLKVMLFMIKAVFTRSWNMSEFEKNQRYPMLQDMTFSIESEEWRDTHTAS